MLDPVALQGTSRTEIRSITILKVDKGTCLRLLNIAILPSSQNALTWEGQVPQMEEEIVTV